MYSNGAGLGVAEPEKLRKNIWRRDREDNRSRGLRGGYFLHRSFFRSEGYRLLRVVFVERVEGPEIDDYDRDVEVESKSSESRLDDIASGESECFERVA